MVTPAYNQEEGVGARPAQKETDWTQSRGFLSKLACLTEESEPAALEPCSAAVHHKYTITGFQNSGDGLQAMVRVKMADGEEGLLSLEPEIAGTVLKLPFEGREVPSFLNDEEKDQLIVPKADWKKSRHKQGGFKVSSIHDPQLRDYILRRKAELLSTIKNGVSLVELFCMQEEFFNKAQYNWAEQKMNYLKKKLLRALTKPPLSQPVQDLLKIYFDAALPRVLKFAARKALHLGSGRKKKWQQRRRGLEEEFENQKTDCGFRRQHEEVEAPRRSKRVRDHAGEDDISSERLDHTGANQTSRERYRCRCENVAGRRPADACANSLQLLAEDELLLRCMNLNEKIVDFLVERGS